jgi:hypothetical protein
MESLTLVDAVFEARIAALAALRRFTRGRPRGASLDGLGEELLGLLAADDRLEAAEAALRADNGNGSVPNLHPVKLNGNDGAEDRG